MKNNSFLLTALMLIMHYFSFSQAPNPLPGSYIEVTGTAEEEVIPDEIFITITLKERYVNKDKLTIDVQEAQLKNAIRAIGIDLKNLYLSDINADYVKVRRQKKDVLTQKDYVLKVSNATVVGQVFLELDKLDIKDGYISRVHHSRIDSLKKEIKIKAIKAAKEKAVYLLAALGEQPGKVLVVTDTPESTFQPFYATPRAMMMKADGFPDEQELPAEIQFQKIKLSSNIYVKFAVK